MAEHKFPSLPLLCYLYTQKQNYYHINTANVSAPFMAFQLSQL